MAVDVVGSLLEASTAQAFIVSSMKASQYSTYQSPLSAYPLLHSRSPPQSLDANSCTELAASHTSDLSVLSPVSLSSLKAAAINRWLSDPSRRVCQYEVPGGGECRDRECEDIHPSRVSAVEPSGTHFSHLQPLLTSLSSFSAFAVCSLSIALRPDEEVAQYLHSALPKGSEVGVEQLQAALQDFRRQQLGFEARVKQALASLGLRMAA